MATTAATAQAFQDHHHHRNSNNNNGNPEFSRHEIQTAIAKAVELRALHAALTQGSSPGPGPSPGRNARFPSPSPASRSASQFSAQDYPVFTPVSTHRTFSLDFFGVPIVFYFLAKLGFDFSYKKENFLGLQLYLASHGTFKD